MGWEYWPRGEWVENLAYLNRDCSWLKIRLQSRFIELDFGFASAIIITDRMESMRSSSGLRRFLFSNLGGAADGRSFAAPIEKEIFSSTKLLFRMCRFVLITEQVSHSGAASLYSESRTNRLCVSTPCESENAFFTRRQN